jgi:hypothetical protein
MKIPLLPVVIALAACAQPEPSAKVGAVTPAPDTTSTASAASPSAQADVPGQVLIVVNDDGTVSGVVEVTPATASMGTSDMTADIEDDTSGLATPVVVMLVPVGDGRWQVPPGTKLSQAQMDHYKSGRLSANVRSKTQPKKDLRASLSGQTRSKAMGAAPATR